MIDTVVIMISFLVVSSIALSRDPHAVPVPWMHTTAIDYQAANEFIDAHYGDRIHTSGKSYFDDTKKSDAVFNARDGYIDDTDGRLRSPSMDLCGFDLLETDVTVKNYRDLDLVRNNYLPELRRFVSEIYPDSKFEHVIFWNPVLREADLKQTRPDNQSDTPTSHFVSTAHIDKDFGAYESVSELVDVFVKNHMHGAGFCFPVAEIETAISVGNRFAVCNFWRNIGMEPVRRAPLAFLSCRYKDPLKAFPDADPDPSRTRWYTYPDMTPTEVLSFCQYDRDVEKPSDMWHCALMDVGEPSVSRMSFDVRCLIVFKDVVPAHRDRFTDGRTRALLTEAQSRKFCTAQSKRWWERRTAKQGS